jgi:hypothetical protein
MQQLLLTKGQFALVDDCYYEQILALGHWCYAHNHYAVLYRRDGERCTTRFLQRVCMELILGHPIPPQLQVDHINRDRLDNQRHNLRLATRSQNQANKGRQVNTSCYKGVNANKGKWEARIRFNGRRVYLGRYSDALTAAMIYDAATRHFNQNFAGCNFSEQETPPYIATRLHTILAKRGL